ncbi:hypothetical protein HYW94_01730 [Candidatus Uhrbacteria bacterium]|nr:hypothetical protein [Candidatus Uhrbacteria bacterium]
MSPQPLQKKKRTNSAALGVIFVLLAGYAGYYFYQIYGPKSSAPVSIVVEKKKLPIKKIDWEKTVYEDPFFLSLKEQMPTQMTVDKIGNKEPFVTKKK